MKKITPYEESPNYEESPKIHLEIERHIRTATIGELFFSSGLNTGEGMDEALLSAASKLHEDLAAHLNAKDVETKIIFAALVLMVAAIEHDNEVDRRVAALVSTLKADCPGITDRQISTALDEGGMPRPRRLLEEGEPLKGCGAREGRSS